MPTPTVPLVVVMPVVPPVSEVFLGADLPKRGKSTSLPIKAPSSSSSKRVPQHQARGSVLHVENDVTNADGCILDALQDREYGAADDPYCPWGFNFDSDSDVDEAPSPPLEPWPGPSAPLHVPAPPSPHDADRQIRPHRDTHVGWPKMVHSVNAKGQSTYLRVSQGHGQ